MKKFLTSLFATFILFAFSLTTSAMASSEENNDLADKVIASAESYLGTPYGGDFDCSGYVFKVFKENGIKLPRSSGSQYKFGESVKKEDLEKGDLVFFNTSGSGISHVGIYIGDNKFIHSQNKKGVSTTSLNDPYYWSSRYVGAAKVLN